MNLPRIVAGTRRWRLLALVGNGLFQGGATFAASWALHRLISGLGVGVSLLPMAVLMGAALLLFALRWREGFDAESLGQDYVVRVRDRLFGRIMALPLEPRQRYRYGTMMVRLTGDLAALKNWVSLGIARLVVSAILLAATLIAIAWFSLPAAAIAAATLGLCVLAGLGATPALRRSVRDARFQRGRLANRLGDRLLAAATFRHLGRAKTERRQLRRDGRLLGRLLARRTARFFALRALAELILPITLAGFVAWLAWRGGTLAPADMAALAVLLGQAAVAMRHAAIAWEYRLTFDQARARLKTILSLKPLRDPGVMELPDEGPARIACTDMRLSDRGPAISLQLDRNDRVLLSGASGAGKSLLLAVLARLVEPAAGHVEIDGRPIGHYSQRSLSRSVRLVSPLLPLVSGSIDHNIRLGRAPGSSVWVTEIVELCGLGRIGAGLEPGCNWRVEDGGRNLPDGLRARILLARALASAPSVLLIDDPSFLVDAEAASALRAALVARPMTVIAVGDRHHDPIGATRYWRLDADGLTELAGPGPKSAAIAGNVHPLPLTRIDHG
ncbi:MAG: ATP-binding cassette domain-containing protein [Pseudomonadota bacterium]